MIRQITIAAAAFAALATVPVPANAANEYGAIAFHGSGDTFFSQIFQNYTSESRLISEIKDQHPGWGYLTFSSGSCGAVARYRSDSGETGFESARSSSADRAATGAMSQARAWGGTAKLVRAFCQD